jgi:hypothetical protein
MNASTPDSRLLSFIRYYRELYQCDPDPEEIELFLAATNGFQLDWIKDMREDLMELEAAMDRSERARFH